MRGLLREEVIALKPCELRKLRFALGFANECQLGRLKASARNSSLDGFVDRETA